MLDHRTDGRNVTCERTLDELKRLNVGYGYITDGDRLWAALSAALPGLRTMSRAPPSAGSAAFRGDAGRLPRLPVAPRPVPLLWGWSHRFSAG